MDNHTSEIWYADIILPKPLRQFYTYIIPTELIEKSKVGCRVIVQFGNRKFYTGIIKEIHQKKPDYEGIKQIDELLDEEPFLGLSHIKFWEWIADYYMCTIGEVYKAALPAGLKIETETKLIANSDFSDVASLNETEEKVFSYIEQMQIAILKDISTIFNLKNPLRVINSLIDKKAIVASERIKHKYKPKKEKYFRLSSKYSSEKALDNIFETLIKAPKQFEIFTQYIELCEDEDEFIEVKKLEFLKSTGSSNSSLKTLIDKGYFEEFSKEVQRIQDQEFKTTELKTLSEAQQEKLKEIQIGFQTQTTGLLHGVTSSGKTEIYIHLIKEMIDQGKQVLYLLPEIALTTQIIQRLKQVFGNQVGVYHSKFSDAERVETYKEVAKGEESRFKLILGVRSSVFLPFSNLGLIIVDEEHENTFKQFDPSPRYHARDASVVLANMYQAKILLGSATPSVESYYNTISGKYFLVELFERHKKIELPKIIISDLRAARRKKKMQSMFTQLMIDEIKDALANKEQVILFQNRRGYSPYIECDTCGWIPYCNHCDVSMTYHKFLQNLQCHYCNHVQNIPSKCPSCGSDQVYAKGFGTEKVEDELSELFPSVKVGRMDLDSTRGKDGHQIIINKFENHEIDILVGTQMISKGLDFENVNLVGILNADSLINYPNYRAFERAFQLMSQVSGRAGRSKKRGKVIIQTSSPDHPVITQVLFNDYPKMFAQQIEERQAFKYPPFYRHIKISLKHKKQYIVERASNQLAASLRNTFGNRVLGPELPVINKIQDYHIRNLHLKIEKEKASKKAKDFIIEACNSLKDHEGFSSIQINFDVDPF